MLTKRPQPLTDSFILAYAADPAFDEARFHVDDKGAPLVDEKGEPAPTVDTTRAFMEAFDRCVETQDFDPLCKPGESPTLFRFRPLKKSEGEAIAAANLGGDIPTALIFRLCLVSITDPDIGSIELKREPFADLRKIGPVLSTKVYDDLVWKLAGFRIVNFLGNYVFARGELDPKR